SLGHVPKLFEVLFRAQRLSASQIHSLSVGPKHLTTIAWCSTPFGISDPFTAHRKRAVPSKDFHTGLKDLAALIKVFAKNDFHRCFRQEIPCFFLIKNLCAHYEAN